MAKPILIKGVCLKCHGAAESLSAQVKSALATHYPDDLATGYKAGGLRGAFFVRVKE